MVTGEIAILACVESAVANFLTDLSLSVGAGLCFDAELPRIPTEETEMRDIDRLGALGADRGGGVGESAAESSTAKSTSNNICLLAEIG